MIILKNWSIGYRPDSTFIAPELRSLHLQGTVYGHHKFDDGKDIITSRIVEIKQADEETLIVHTISGSEYEIHKADLDPITEEEYPDYWNRMIGALNENV